MDSKDRYKIEVHFSPEAKEQEEIIAAGECVSCLGLDSKKNVIPLKRQLPDENRLSRKSCTSSMQSGTTMRIKRQTQLPLVLMGSEQLATLIEKGTVCG